MTRRDSSSSTLAPTRRTSAATSTIVSVLFQVSTPRPRRTRHEAGDADLRRGEPPARRASSCGDDELEVRRRRRPGSATRATGSGRAARPSRQCGRAVGPVEAAVARCRLASHRQRAAPRGAPRPGSGRGRGRRAQAGPLGERGSRRAAGSMAASSARMAATRSRSRAPGCHASVPLRRCPRARRGHGGAARAASSSRRTSAVGQPDAGRGGARCRHRPRRGEDEPRPRAAGRQVDADRLRPGSRRAPRASGRRWRARRRPACPTSCACERREVLGQRVSLRLAGLRGDVARRRPAARARPRAPSGCPGTSRLRQQARVEAARADHDEVRARGWPRPLRRWPRPWRG